MAVTFVNLNKDALHPDTLPSGGFCNPPVWSISGDGSSLFLSYDYMSKNGRDDYNVFGWEGGNNQTVLFYYVKIVLYKNYIYNSEAYGMLGQNDYSGNNVWCNEKLCRNVYNLNINSPGTYWFDLVNDDTGIVVYHSSQLLVVP